MNADTATTGKTKVAESVYDWMSAFIFALMVLVFILTVICRNATVSGESMVPTLQNGDKLLITGFTDTYERGDIIVINRYVEEPLIKRVIAVAGDRIRIENFNVYVNGEKLNEPYIQGMTVSRDAEGVRIVPDGCLFVMGDNRLVSMDSRMDEVGMISVKDVVGKAFFRVWPIASVGKVG